MATQLLSLLPLVLFASLALSRVASAQAGAPPVDQSEGGGAEGAPLRIGSSVLSGSMWVDATYAPGDHGEEGRDTFRIRRARVGLAGNLTPRLGYNLSAELTAQPVPRNAFLQLRITDFISVRAGQANPISTLERGTSPLAIEAIDRSIVTNELTGPADVGVSVFTTEPYRDWLGLALNIVNGSGFNRVDNNDDKDVSGRVAVSPPALPGLMVVASGAHGKQPNGPRTRSGLGVDYRRGDWHVMAEALRQRRDRLPGSHGYFGMVAYRLRPSQPTPNLYQLEFVGRFSVLNDYATAAGTPSDVVNDEGGSTSGIGVATKRELQGGMNWYLNANIRLMTNVIMPFDDRPNTGASLVARWQVTF